MKQILLIIIVPFCFLASCGPSRAEVEARAKYVSDSIDVVNNARLEKQKAEEDEQRKVVQAEKDKKYFLANQFDLIPGRIVGWAPTDEEIFTWKCNGGTVPDRTIYIHIQDQYGMVTVMKCSHMAWINLHTGDVLR